MIFELDEDLKNLELEKPVITRSPFSDNEETIISNDECHDMISEPPQSLQDYLDVDVPSARHTEKRRPSAVAKFSVLSPMHTRKVSISSAKNGDETNASPHSDTGVTTSSPTSNHTSGDPNSRNLQDFQPVRVLGKGAYGKVILVKDQKSNKLFAMKQLKKAEILINEQEIKDDAKEDKPDNKNIERTFAEKTILSELEHPNIVKLFYSFHDVSKLYLILQYVPGGELFFHLKEHGTLDEDTVSFYAAEISCALKFLHDKGIVYRDLKPENCLLNDRGHLVLTDFGLSKKSLEDNDMSNQVDDVFTLHSIIGTPEYAAPEILQGLPYNKNCDWYSLGCLLFDMLVGKPPYTGTNHKVIINKIQKDKNGPKIPYYLSEGMKDMLNWLLKKDKLKRWQVDKYWAETREDSRQGKGKKKKVGKQRELKYQSHFIFRKIDWKLMESGDLQHTTLGPIVPLITDWELAENFDSEFTSMSYDDGYTMEIPARNSKDDLFKGFSYKASGSYLDRYF
ncbi:putative protein kinase YPK3 KNAG_0J01290 [Huiozyma naganishii CBS 8797]|uniref:Protein kinase domain-containing protein n=1 Tax=Huiozyma naganishii (strain ATCC MYA-139 / BCRC 22969 / CBS 8797 / KCTC 17520 / NBRC 10181 / NCYC 3082 / Yp74L-3) TaxID=1071383 RepID=J7RBF5_HUIN7|nr:hypothetical protein KNAG_0J01290 [Kazachstania naganishii CBS 8797]CCK72210.1 hypothetical protein KNAG_0J01290 [Kazachstania naganishii CBS 8797]